MVNACFSTLRVESANSRFIRKVNKVVTILKDQSDRERERGEC